jgi:hypothetical protein
MHCRKGCLDRVTIIFLDTNDNARGLAGGTTLSQAVLMDWLRESLCLFLQVT